MERNKRYTIRILYKQECCLFHKKQGIITLIPKSDKDLSYLKNWRPITLLTVDHRILSSVLATRLKSTLNDLIHEDQTGFIKGRHMSEYVRKAIEMIEYLEDEDLSGLIMTIDFDGKWEKFIKNFGKMNVV